MSVPVGSLVGVSPKWSSFSSSDGLCNFAGTLIVHYRIPPFNIDIHSPFEEQLMSEKCGLYSFVAVLHVFQNIANHSLNRAPSTS
jgi:hypothetical protein